MDKKLANSILKLYKEVTGNYNANYEDICKEFAQADWNKEPDSNVVNPLLADVGGIANCHKCNGQTNLNKDSKTIFCLNCGFGWFYKGDYSQSVYIWNQLANFR